MDGLAVRARVGSADEPGVGEHAEVLGDGLDRHVVRGRQLAEGGVPDGQPGDEVAPDGISERREDPVEPVIVRGRLSRLLNHAVEMLAPLRADVNRLVEDR